jgi:hypothetical protein
MRAVSLVTDYRNVRPLDKESANRFQIGAASTPDIMHLFRVLYHYYVHPQIQQIILAEG